MSKDKELKNSILGPEAVSEEAAQPKKSKKELVAEAFAKAEKKGVLVEATQKGCYPNCTRRKVGDKFKVIKEQHFSFNWMKLAE